MRKKYNYKEIRPARGEGFKKKTIYEPCRTEQAGYITVKEQIRRMQIAGENLVNWRREQFHFAADENIPAGFFDETISPGFDRVDAYEAMQELNEKAKQKKEQNKIKKSLQNEMENDILKAGGNDEKNRPASSDIGDDENPSSAEIVKRGASGAESNS